MHGSNVLLSTDGAGLFCGVLRSFLARGPSCPKILAATHFLDVFRQDLLDTSLPINFLHMQILLPSADSNGDTAAESSVEGDGEDVDQLKVMKGETITYLYR